MFLTTETLPASVPLLPRRGGTSGRAASVRRRLRASSGWSPEAEGLGADNGLSPTSTSAHNLASSRWVGATHAAWVFSWPDTPPPTALLVSSSLRPSSAILTGVHDGGCDLLRMV